jgi:NADPH:quinone reductase-like Zn-dependent oxidoreductase/acyl carrier protein
VESDVFLVDASGAVLVSFEGVTIQRVGKPVDSSGPIDVAEWLYQIGWQSSPLESEAAKLNGRYVLFADQSGFANVVAEKIKAAGASVSLVKPGTTFEAGDAVSTIRPTESDDYAQLLKSSLANGEPVTCVHLWTLDCQDPTTGSTDAIRSARDLGVASVLRLTQQAARITDGKPPQVWVVTGSAHNIIDSDQPVAAQSPTIGLVRVATVEHPELGCRLVDIDGNHDSAADAFVNDLAAPSKDNQIAYRGDQRFVARLESDNDQPEEEGTTDTMRVPSDGPFRLRISAPGSFDALYYENFELTPPPAGSVEMEVKATGLNFSDVLKALGLYPGITDTIVPMGIEASGVVTAVGEGVDRFKVGDEVMGVAPYSFASHAVTAEYALVKKPSNVTHEEASTIPVTFLTAYYGLIRLAGMAKGERVLIHAGAGGVGQAAIQIAKHVGAEIFATAGSDEKRDFLRSLGVDHVMNSRTLEFADEIREITNREGVDIVLNSLPGDAITESLGVLRAYGRFLEIGKTDIYSNTMIGLLPFQDNLSYFAIDLDRMLRQRPDYIRTMFAEMMKFFEDGTYNPMAFTRFNSEQTIDAYRYMAQRKNIGKVVVSVERSEGVDEEFVATFHPSKEGTYLITGGLGALGLQVADWLAERGAGHVALMSRRAPDAAKRESIKALESKNIRVTAIQGDVTDRASLRSALDQIPDDFGPLKGVIHAAGVLADGVMFDMDLDQLDKPLGAKIQGSWNLHEATRDHDLDCFVLFSSIACVLGSPGQSNYAAGNAYLDGIAAMRQSQGLPAVSINWGPWANSGMATEEGREEQLANRGMGMLPAQESLDVMGDLIAKNAEATAVMSVNWANLVRASGNNIAPLLTDVAAGVEIGNRGDSAEDRAFRQMISEMSVKDRNVKLSEFFAGQLARIMGMELEDIEVATPLNAMGLDSLMAIELKNKIESQLQMSLPMAVFMNEPSVATIADYVSENFGKEPSESESNGQA